MPSPCWPRWLFSVWNLEPYRSWPKIFGIWGRTIPGPLSSTRTRNRSSVISWIEMRSSGRMPASSHASRALSTASFTVVRRAFWGLSKPSRWRFLVKNSEMEISRCFAARLWAVSRVRRVVVAPSPVTPAGGSSGPAVTPAGACGPAVSAAPCPSPPVLVDLFPLSREGAASARLLRARPSLARMLPAPPLRGGAASSWTEGRSDPCSGPAAGSDSSNSEICCPAGVFLTETF